MSDQRENCTCLNKEKSMKESKLPPSLVRAARKVMEEHPEMVGKIENAAELARSSLLNGKLKPVISEEFRKRLERWSKK